MADPREGPETLRGRFGVHLTQKMVITLSIGFTMLFTFIAWLIVVAFLRKPFLSVFEGSQPLPLQAFVGLLLGVVLSVVCVAILVRLPLLADFRNLAQTLLTSVRPTRFDMMLVALGAGWSEELLFRGTLQPLISIWWTSLLFAILHVGVDLRSRGRILFGLFVFFGSVAMGLLYEWVGLVAAMITHGTFDLIVMLGLKWSMEAEKMVGSIDETS